MVVPLHKHALALSPVKLTFLSPRPAGEAPHHRQVRHGMTAQLDP